MLLWNSKFLNVLDNLPVYKLNILSILKFSNLAKKEKKTKLSANLLGEATIAQSNLIRITTSIRVFVTRTYIIYRLWREKQTIEITLISSFSKLLLLDSVCLGSNSHIFFHCPLSKYREFLISGEQLITSRDACAEQTEKRLVLLVLVSRVGYGGLSQRRKVSRVPPSCTTRWFWQPRNTIKRKKHAKLNQSINQ